MTVIFSHLQISYSNNIPRIVSTNGSLLDEQNFYNKQHRISKDNYNAAITSISLVRRYDFIPRQ